MDTTIYKRRKIWLQMPNSGNKWKQEYSSSNSLISLATQNAKSKSSSFIVDWQLSESNQDGVQLNLYFKE